MDCRTDCGACCIAPSISSPIPGMPDGKPANTRCTHLADTFLCQIFTSPLPPKVCASLPATRELSCTPRDQAPTHLIKLEADTAPETTAAGISSAGLSTFFTFQIHNTDPTTIARAA